MVVHLHLGADVRTGGHGPLDRARRTRPSRLHLPTDSPSLLLNCPLTPIIPPSSHHRSYDVYSSGAGPGSRRGSYRRRRWLPGVDPGPPFGAYCAASQRVRRNLAGLVKLMPASLRT